LVSEFYYPLDTLPVVPLERALGEAAAQSARCSTLFRHITLVPTYAIDVHTNYRVQASNPPERLARP